MSRYSFLLTLLAATLGTACADLGPKVDDPSGDGQPTSTDPGDGSDPSQPADVGSVSEAAASAPDAKALSFDSVYVGDCQFAIYSPTAARNGFAQLGCSNSDDIKLQVCLQQLVTGGWQTIQWTCVTTHGVGYYIDQYSGKVPYYTSGRWYRTWAWAYNNGKTHAMVSSDGYKG